MTNCWLCSKKVGVLYATLAGHDICIKCTGKLVIAKNAGAFESSACKNCGGKK